MSLVGTLAKLAIGYAVTRGVKSVVGGGGTKKRTGGGGSIFGGQTSGGTSGLEGIMDGLTGGRSTGRASTGGGLGDILGQLGGMSGGSTSGSTGGSMGGLGGALGGILGGLGGATTQSGGQSTGGGLGDLLTEALGGGGQLQTQTTDEDEEHAGLLIRAMLQAAKSDGRVDAEEREKLQTNLNDATAEEIAYINQELNRDVDLRGLIADVPRGMESQVYMMSLMGIDLDNQNEAQYLNDLAQGMRLGKSDVNQIHEALGVQPLYA